MASIDHEKARAAVRRVVEDGLRRNAERNGDASAVAMTGANSVELSFSNLPALFVPAELGQ